MSKSIEDLERALRAYVFYTHNIAQIIHLKLNHNENRYHASEKCGEGERNPDLHYNRGNVLKFMERYEEAAKSYARASEIDSTLPAESSLFNMKRRFLNVVSLVQKRGRTFCNLKSIHFQYHLLQKKHTHTQNQYRNETETFQNNRVQFEEQKRGFD